MKIALACDHGGFTLKEEIKKYLLDNKYEVEDFINHPLSKFTSDIFEQISELDLHKK